MEKIALITDSACDIDQETLNKSAVFMLPFQIIYKEKEYIDKIEISSEQIYDHLVEEIPKTSLPSLKTMQELYAYLEKESYTHVIAIMISSGISGAANALRLVSQDFPHIESNIVDTKCVSVFQGVLLKKCVELREKGEKFSEIIAKIDSFKEKIHLFFVFGTLDYAIKGGRIGKVAGTLGNLLDIKPIVIFDRQTGVICTYKKVRGRKRSLNQLTDLVNSLDRSKKYDVYVAHANALKEAEQVVARLKEKATIVSAYLVGQISGVVGIYAGPGTVGVCFSEHETLKK